MLKCHQSHARLPIPHWMEAIIVILSLRQHLYKAEAKLIYEFVHFIGLKDHIRHLMLRPFVERYCLP